VENLEKYFEIAKVFYGDIPYHNFEHALKVLGDAKKIMEACVKEGIVFDDKAVILACLFHDAGYHEDHEEKGFATKEKYSSFLAMEEIGKEDRELGKKVSGIILATHTRAQFDSVEEKIVRAADLSGLASGYGEFLENNRKLKKEAELSEGGSVPWSYWKEGTSRVVNFYLSQDIRLTKEHDDRDGNSIFHVRAKDNLDKFLKENDEDLDRYDQ